MTSSGTAPLGLTLTEPLPSTMKLSDAHTKLRTDCAAVYKRYDRNLEGQVSRQEFGKIHRELVREKLVKLDLDSCVSILDSKGDGIVYFNVFISWIERVEFFVLNCLTGP
jgi:Ca2+-binding EF-hand superfamily protein